MSKIHKKSWFSEKGSALCTVTFPFVLNNLMEYSLNAKLLLLIYRERALLSQRTTLPSRGVCVSLLATKNVEFGVDFFFDPLNKQ